MKWTTTYYNFVHEDQWFRKVLQSGWPIFGLLGLVAYKLSRDGAGKDVCDQTTESFRIRYEDGFWNLRTKIQGKKLTVAGWISWCLQILGKTQEVMLEGKEVPFSRDVENTAVELLQHLEQNRTLGPMSRVSCLSLEIATDGIGGNWWMISLLHGRKVHVFFGCVEITNCSQLASPTQLQSMESGESVEMVETC